MKLTRVNRVFILFLAAFFINFTMVQLFCQEIPLADNGLEISNIASEENQHAVGQLASSGDETIKANEGNDDIEKALAGLLQMLNAQQPQAEQGENNQTRSGVDFAQFATADMQQALAQLTKSAFQQIFAQEQKKGHSALLLLSEEMQKDINNAHDAYQLIIQEITIASTLTSLCVSVRQAVNQLDEKSCLSQEVAAKLDLQLSSFHEALVTGSVDALLQTLIPTGEKMGMNIAAVDPSSLMMQFMQGGMLNKTRSEIAYTLEDVKALNVVLQEASCIIFDQVENKKTFELLCSAINEFANGNVAKLAHITFAHTHAHCIQVMKQLDEVCTLLDKKFAEKAGMSVFEYIKKRQSMSEGEQEQRPRAKEITEQDALAYWYKELKKYSQTLLVFNKLKDSARLDQAGGEGLMAFYHYIAHAYDIGMDFFNLYMRDHNRPEFKWHNSRILIPYFINYAMRGALSAWVYNDNQEKMCRGGALQLALGKSSLTSQNYANFLLSRWGAIAMAAQAFIMPSFGQKAPHGLIQGLSKVLVSWSYYHMCHVSLFGEERIYWPSNNKFLLESLIFGAQQVSKTVTDELSWQVRLHADPASLEKLEDISWGVIRPEMLSAVLDSFIPYIFLHLPKKFANAHRNDVYGVGFRDGIVNTFLTRYKENPNHAGFQQFNRDLERFYQGRREEIIGDTGLPLRSRRVPRGGQEETRELKALDMLRDDGVLAEMYAFRNPDVIMQYYQNLPQADMDLYYIEQNLVNYAASSIGMYWGRNLTKKYKPYVTSFFSKAFDFGIDCLETVGFLSEGTAEGVLIMKDDLAEDMDEVLGMLKALISQLLEQQSPLRPMVLRLLIEYGYLDKDETDPQMINRSMVIGILSELIRLRLFSNSEAALIIQSFEENLGNIKGVVDGIVDGLKDNVIALGGGVVGSAVLSAIASAACWQWGPFYPKVQKAFAK